MTPTSAVVVGLGAALVLVWLVWRFVVPRFQTQGYLTIALLALLYAFGMLKLFTER